MYMLYKCTATVVVKKHTSSMHFVCTDATHVDGVVEMTAVSVIRNRRIDGFGLLAARFVRGARHHD